MLIVGLKITVGAALNGHRPHMREAAMRCEAPASLLSFDDDHGCVA